MMRNKWLAVAVAFGLSFALLALARRAEAQVLFGSVSGTVTGMVTTTSPIFLPAFTT